MSSSDDEKDRYQNSRDVDWKKLESEVNEITKVSFFNILIKKNIPCIVFDSKTIKECKYIQKLAEFNISIYMSWFSIAIFVIALGFAYYITFYYQNFITSILGLIPAIIFTVFLVIFVFPKYIISHKIILDAEKRILSDNKEEPNHFKVNTIQNDTKKILYGDQNCNNNEIDARIGYQVAVDLLIAEGEGIWSRFNVMLLANSIILAIIGLALTSESTSPVFDIYLPFIGITLCIWWFFLINRSYSYRDYFIHTARELEQQYLASSVKILSCGEFISKSGIPARYVSYFVILAFLVLYGILIFTGLNIL